MTKAVFKCGDFMISNKCSLHRQIQLLTLNISSYIVCEIERNLLANVREPVRMNTYYLLFIEFLICEYSCNRVCSNLLKKFSAVSNTDLQLSDPPKEGCVFPLK
jgi:hypothetical protein